jgi:hypothetical protein
MLVLKILGDFFAYQSLLSIEKSSFYGLLKAFITANVYTTPFVSAAPELKAASRFSETNQSPLIMPLAADGAHAHRSGCHSPILLPAF